MVEEGRLCPGHVVLHVRSSKVAKEPHHRPVDIADSWRTVRIIVSRCLSQSQFSGEIL